MLGFGPIGTPDRMILWYNVYAQGNSALRHEVRVHENVPRWRWQLCTAGSVITTVILEPGEVNTFVTTKPKDTKLRMALVPSGTRPAASNFWFRNSPRATLRWTPVVDADAYRIYYDAGLGGAVDTLVDTVGGDETEWTDAERAAGTYVYNVIPAADGNTVLAAAVDDASHEDITHTVNTIVDPPSALKIDSVTYDGGPTTHDIVVSWTASPTAGVTYDIKTSIAGSAGADPDAINVDGTWTTGVTSPYSVPTLTGDTGKLWIVQVRAVKSGEYAYSNVVNYLLTADNIVPDDSQAWVSHVRNDAGTVKVTFDLLSEVDFGATLTADLRHTTTSGSSYTEVSAWQTPARATTADGGYRYRGEASVAGLSTGNTYYFQVRGRNASLRTEWSREVSFAFNAAPAVAPLFNETHGG